MTPMWEELAGHTPDAAAAIKTGENAQASIEGIFTRSWKVTTMVRYPGW